MFTYERRLRFEDADVGQVLFYPRYFALCYEALEALLAEEITGGYPGLLRERGLAFPTVHASSDFEHPIVWGDSARVELAVERIGDTSVSFYFEIYRGSDGIRAASIRQTHVLCTIANFAKANLPEDLRGALSPHLVEAAAPPTDGESVGGDAGDTIPPPAATDDADFGFDGHDDAPAMTVAEPLTAP